MSKKILCENTCSLDENEKVSVGEKLAYGGGDLACNLINLLAFSLVTFFYTDALGLNAVSYTHLQRLYALLKGGAAQ